MTNSADLASCESADIQRRILELIEGASSIAISGHTSPDGDALGSVLGLGPITYPAIFTGSLADENGGA